MLGMLVAFNGVLDEQTLKTTIHSMGYCPIDDMHSKWALFVKMISIPHIEYKSILSTTIINKKYYEISILSYPILIHGV